MMSMWDFLDHHARDIGSLVIVLAGLVFVAYMARPERKGR
jgi:hypothetical protein